MTTAESFLNYLIKIVSSLIPIMIVLAVLAFFWGVVKFVAHADDEKQIAEGREIMVWGLVGLFVLVGLWGIVGYLQTTLGLKTPIPLSPLYTLPGSVPTP